MAERYPTPPTQLDTVVNEINETFDNLILQLNNRRQALLDEVRVLSEEMTDTETRRKIQIEDLIVMKASIQVKLKHNEMRDAQERLLAEVDQQLDRLDMSNENECLSFKFSEEKIKEAIFSFGSIVKREVIIPNYSNMKQPIIAVGNSREIKEPYGVAFCEETKQIFIADWTGDSCIHLFTENGMFVKRIGTQTVMNPRGVAVFKNSLYVTDTMFNAIILYKLPEGTLVKSVPSFSLGVLKWKDQFNTRGLTVSNNGDVFITDNNSNKIVVMDGNLTYKHQLTHTCITKPLDVMIHYNTLFILCKATDPAIQVLSMKGDYLYSIITREQVKKCLYFCIDIIGNIIMSDLEEHNIKIFNKKGALMHVIGKKGQKKGEFYEPKGIAVTSSGKLITVSQNNNCCLQIYQ